MSSSDFWQVIICTWCIDKHAGRNTHAYKIKKYLKENLSEYKGKIENIVLGCTHYPLIQNQIKEVVGEVKFFNGAPNVAKHLKEVLEEKNLLNKEKSIGKINFIDSRNSKLKEERFFKYLEEV